MLAFIPAPPTNGLQVGPLFFHLYGLCIALGVLAAFIQLTRRFFQPLQDLSEKFNLLQSAMASSDRVFALLDQPVTVSEPVHPVRLPQPAPGR